MQLFNKYTNTGMHSGNNSVVVGSNLHLGKCNHKPKHGDDSMVAA